MILLSAALSGFFLGASLIIAIGAQNAFVLRQGLLRQHVFVVATICAVSDLVLIIIGVAGVGTLVNTSPALLGVAAGGGALFLIVYGIISFRRAAKPNRLEASGEGGLGIWAAVATCLLLTWGNPHVYLDTVVLMGSISGRFTVEGRMAFAAGGALSSIVWFYGLGYGARMLQPVFRNPNAWRVLDALIGVVMWMIAGRLIIDLIDLIR